MIRDAGRRDVVPCGKCNYCLQTKRADWSFRLIQELKVADSAHFLTMTYNEDELPRSDSGIPSLNKEHVQLFQKRLREVQRRAYPGSTNLRYYTVGEYGTRTLRPHYHSILFNLQGKLLPQITDIWSHGGVFVGDVTGASIHYVTKYVINRTVEIDSDLEPP